VSLKYGAEEARDEWRTPMVSATGKRSRFDVLKPEVERVRQATRAQMRLLGALPVAAHITFPLGEPDKSIAEWEKAVADLITAAYELGRKSK
jgi:L-ribulose-5-phosphate 3-epimerase UlaE